MSTSEPHAASQRLEQPQSNERTPSGTPDCCIYLVGFSGTGKSTVAKLVGTNLHRRVYDVDDIIQEQAGITIPAIFRDEGELGFRSREREALKLVSRSGPVVVATGGGIVMAPENRAIMADTGWLICLDAHPDTIFARLREQQRTDPMNSARPLLGTVNSINHLRALKEGRQPAYALSDWTVHTDRLTVSQVATEVIRAKAILDATTEQLCRFGGGAIT